MALVLNDRVKETAQHWYRCTMALSGVAVGQGFETFVSQGIGTGNTTYYCIFESRYKDV